MERPSYYREARPSPSASRWKKLPDALMRFVSSSSTGNFGVLSNQFFGDATGDPIGDPAAPFVTYNAPIPGGVDGDPRSSCDCDGVYVYCGGNDPTEIDDALCWWRERGSRAGYAEGGVLKGSLGGEPGDEDHGKETSDPPAVDPDPPRICDAGPVVPVGG